MKYRIAFTALSASILALTCAAQVSGPTPDGRSGKPERSGVCTHLGTQHVPMHSYTSGVYSCGAGLKINVMTTAGSVTVQTTPACPTYVVTVPPHNKRVQKLHFNATFKSEVQGWDQDHKCTGALFWKKCVPTGPKKSNEYYRDDYQESGCDVLG